MTLSRRSRNREEYHPGNPKTVCYPTTCSVCHAPIVRVAFCQGGGEFERKEIKGRYIKHSARCKGKVSGPVLSVDLQFALDGKLRYLKNAIYDRFTKSEAAVYANTSALPDDQRRIAILDSWWNFCEAHPVVLVTEAVVSLAPIAAHVPGCTVEGRGVLVRQWIRSAVIEEAQKRTQYWFRWVWGRPLEVLDPTVKTLPETQETAPEVEVVTISRAGGQDCSGVADGSTNHDRGENSVKNTAEEFSGQVTFPPPWFLGQHQTVADTANRDPTRKTKQLLDDFRAHDANTFLPRKEVRLRSRLEYVLEQALGQNGDLLMHHLASPVAMPQPIAAASQSQSTPTHGLRKLAAKLWNEARAQRGSRKGKVPDKAVASIAQQLSAAGFRVQDLPRGKLRTLVNNHNSKHSRTPERQLRTFETLARATKSTHPADSPARMFRRFLSDSARRISC